MRDTSKQKNLSETEPDTLWGAEAIGREIGRTAAQVHYLHSRGRLPTRKLSRKTMIASRAQLRELFASKT